MNNGVRLEDQQWGVEHAPNIDVNALSNITVIKGSNALKYGGDAIGGVIVTNQRKAPLLDTLMGKVIANAVSNGRGGNMAVNLIKAKKNGLNFRAQGSLKRLGDFQAADYVLTNTGVRENNFSVGLGLNKINQGFDVTYSRFSTEIGILRASHTGNADNFFFATIASQPDIVEPFSYDINVPRQEVTHQVVKATGFRKIKDFGTVNLQYDYQNNRRFEFDIRRGDDRNTASLDLELQTHSLLIDAVYDKNEKFDVNFGLMGRYQNNFPNPETGVRRFIPDYDKYDAGAYITANVDISDKIALDAGLRFDYNQIDAQ
jgi:iron complex outermembrane receptor protein